MQIVQALRLGATACALAGLLGAGTAAAQAPPSEAAGTAVAQAPSSGTANTGTAQAPSSGATGTLVAQAPPPDQVPPPGVFAPPGAPPPPPTAAPPPAPAPAPPPPPASPFQVLTGVGQDLANAGIYFNGSYNQMVLGNVSGGRVRGWVGSGEMAFGGVLDLNKIAGIPHASLHLTFDARNGVIINNLYGSEFLMANNNGPTDTVRLSEFYWEQGLFNNAVNIKFGRTNPTLDFAVGDLSCTYVTNIFCAQPGIWYLINQNQAYPVSTWGGRVRVAGGPYYWMLGLYQNQPFQGRADQHGFSWNFGGGNGVFVPVEMGYLTTFDNARYPAKYDIGGYWSSEAFTPPNGLENRGRGAGWVQLQQTVWRPDPRTNQSLTAFAGALVTNAAFTPFNAEYYAGLYDRAPFGPVRPNDTLQGIFSYTTLNRAVSPFAQTWAFELDYAVSVIPGVTFQPVVQYLIHPDGIGFSNVPPGGYKNAWGVGAWIIIDFNALTGLPNFKGN